MSAGCCCIGVPIAGFASADPIAPVRSTFAGLKLASLTLDFQIGVPCCWAMMLKVRSAMR